MTSDTDEQKAYHEAQRAYFRDPTIQWFDPGELAEVGISEPGHYVLGSCGEPGCCYPVGPFSTPEEALEYSRQHLVERQTAREAAQANRRAGGAREKTPVVAVRGVKVMSGQLRLRKAEERNSD
jgi:hypothetical protein